MLERARENALKEIRKIEREFSKKESRLNASLSRSASGVDEFGLYDNL